MAPGSIRMTNPLRPPVWVQLNSRTRTEEQRQESRLQEKHQYMMRRAPHGTRKLLGHSAVVYSFGPWTATTVNRGQLPFKIAEGTGKATWLRSPDRKVGFSDINRETSSFRLKDAIEYSYWRDMRFALTLCAIIGFSVWWFTAQELLVLRNASSSLTRS